MDIDREQFKQLMQGDKPVLVDFWAPWCVCCNRIEGDYDRVAQQYGDTVVAAKVNIDSEPQLANAEEIEVIPTLVLYKNGKAMDSIVAPADYPMIIKFLQNALEKQDSCK